jgi:hypothetical protein
VYTGFPLTFKVNVAEKKLDNIPADETGSVPGNKPIDLLQNVKNFFGSSNYIRPFQGDAVPGSIKFKIRVSYDATL